MTKHTPIEADAQAVVSALPVWVDRYEAFKGTGYWKAALLTIAAEARGRYEGDPMKDERFAVLCEDAANAANAEERVMLLEEIEDWFAAEAWQDDFDARCYSFEQRNNGKPWDTDDRLWREWDEKRPVRVGGLS